MTQGDDAEGCDMCALDEHTNSGAQGEGIKQMMEKKADSED